jgi:hypothetical protein
LTAIDIFKLPSEVFFSWSETGRRLEYVGSRGIARVGVDVTNGGRPIFSTLPVTRLTVDARDVPFHFTAAVKFAPDGETFQGVTVDGHGGTLSFLQVALLTGAAGGVGGDEGVELRDEYRVVERIGPLTRLARDFFLHVRVLGLQLVDTTLTDSCTGRPTETRGELCHFRLTNHLIRRSPSSVFRIHLKERSAEQAAAGESPATTTASLTNLPRETSVSFETKKRALQVPGLDAVPRRWTEVQRIGYSGSAPGLTVDLLRDESHSGEYTKLSTDPLPREFSFCRAVDGQCLRPAEVPQYNDGSIVATGSDRVKLSLNNCLRAASGRDGCAERLKIDDLAFRVLRFAQDSRGRSNETERNKILLDTAGFDPEGRPRPGYDASGAVAMRDYGFLAPDHVLMMPAGFRALDRMLTYDVKNDLTPPPIRIGDPTGFVSCPPGTLLRYGALRLMGLLCG